MIRRWRWRVDPGRSQWGIAGRRPGCGSPERSRRVLVAGGGDSEDSGDEKTATVIHEPYSDELLDQKTAILRYSLVRPSWHRPHDRPPLASGRPTTDGVSLRCRS